MEKRSLNLMLVISLFLSLFLIPVFSAGVYFSQPESSYNLGDIIDITLDIEPLEEGPIEIDLICEDSHLVSYDSAPTKTFNFKLPLNFANIPDLDGGECYFSAEYFSQTYTSRSFKISRKLNVDLSKDALFSKPNEEIIVSGNVKRLSGAVIDGEVEIDIPLLELAEQTLVESLEEEGWKQEAKDLATNKWETNDYLEIYNAIDDLYDNIESKENIEYVKLKKEEVSSMNAKNKDAVVSQKLKVKYESLEEVEEENETVEKNVNKIVYINLLSIINDGDVDSQDFKKSNDEDDEEDVKFDNGMFFGKVIDGQFSVSFSLAEDTPAGDYRIDVLVYETDSSGEKTSEGVAMANLKISQVLNSIDIALGNVELDPGEELSFKPNLIDQAGFLIEDEVSIIIQDEEAIRIFEKIVPSGETIKYNIQTNLTSGYYEIYASSDGITKTKKFYVNEKAIISFKINNQTLTVTNVGNIPYKKNIQINLGEESFVRSLNLDLGESQEFELEGYDGEYDVWVSDGDNEITQPSVSLTGNAVNVKAAGNSLLTTPIIWIFLIIILGAGFLFLFRNVLKKKSFAYPFKKLFHRKTIKLNNQGKITKEPGEKESEKRKPEKTVEKKSFFKKKESKTPSRHEAEQVLVLRGQKNRATVVALHIKNKINKTAKKGLESAIEHVYEKRGAVYERGDNIFIVFSPLMTRSFKNEIKAAKAAEKIISALKEHNKKFADKIDFGVGINSGNIISKFENKKLKFTALGNLIGPAKRLAQASKGQLLITKEAYERGISDIKAQKKKFKGTDVYEVRRIMDQEKNKAFIHGFLKRMKKEGEEK